MFLAPQEAIAEEVPVILPVQALPTVKPCAYVDIRIAMEADRAVHVGAMVAFPKEAFGLLQRTGGKSLTLAVGSFRASGGGGSTHAAGPRVASADGPTSRELPLPPQCRSTAPYGHPLPFATVEGPKSAWCERLLVMAESGFLF